MNKKVLLLSYYWPPAGGGGVQRWLKMNKYLPEFGVNLVVYTAKPKSYVAEDQNLVKEIHPTCEVIRKEIWEPYSLYSWFTGQGKQKNLYSGFMSEKKNTGLSQRISLFVRSNFFIPDARRFWINPSARFLIKWIKEHKIDALISTGPPHSMHLIALKIKKSHPEIPWIADFRDPWTNIDFYSKLKLTRWADKKHKNLENNVFQTADKIVTVSWNWQREFQELSGRNDVELIFNGYDPDDFRNSVKRSEEFTICHLGSMNEDRNVKSLWKVLSEVSDKNPLFKDNARLHLIGPIDGVIRESIDKAGIKDIFIHTPFLPHDEAINEMRKSSVLLLPINKSNNNKGILPGKLYEYLATGIPILAIGPPVADYARILNEYRLHQVCNYGDTEKIRDFIGRQFSEYLKDNTPSVPTENIEKFSRRMLAKKYAELIAELCID